VALSMALKASLLSLPNNAVRLISVIGYSLFNVAV